LRRFWESAFHFICYAELVANCVAQIFCAKKFLQTSYGPGLGTNASSLALLSGLFSYCKWFTIVVSRLWLSFHMCHTFRISTHTIIWM